MASFYKADPHIVSRYLVHATTASEEDGDYLLDPATWDSRAESESDMESAAAVSDLDETLPTKRHYRVREIEQGRQDFLKAEKDDWLPDDLTKDFERIKVEDVGRDKDWADADTEDEKDDYGDDVRACSRCSRFP